jgi:hypothetical protein
MLNILTPKIPDSQTSTYLPRVSRIRPTHSETIVKAPKKKGKPKTESRGQKQAENKKALKRQQTPPIAQQ